MVTLLVAGGSKLPWLAHARALGEAQREFRRGQLEADESQDE